MGPQLVFPPGAGLVLEQVRLCGEIVRLLACCAAAGADCPACGSWSEALHSQYERATDQEKWTIPRLSSKVASRERWKSSTA